MCKSGIYAIINKINNKMYIGSAIDIFSRWSQHRHHLLRNSHHSSRLQNSWNKYNQNNFEFKVLYYVINKKDLILYEQAFLDEYKTHIDKFGYNIQSNASSSIGIKRSDQCKQKLRNINLGKKLSEETKKKIGDFWRGKSRPKEQIEKMKITRKKNGRPIIQLTLKDEFINEYMSIRDCADQTGFPYSCIQQCCYGKSSMSNGFKWRFKDNPIIYKNKPRNNKSVIQYSKDWKFINQYQSIREACKKNNLQLGNNHIRECCIGKQKYAYGFRWKYRDL